MGLYYFTEKQVEVLSKNRYVKNVSIKAITYTKEFKEHFIKEYNLGKLPNQIFSEAGFDLLVLGKKRIQSSSDRWRSQSKRLEGLKDKRLVNSGRPRTRHLTKDEIIERQKIQIEILKQERDFLLELERLERIAIKKEKSSQKINTKSSKD